MSYDISYILTYQGDVKRANYPSTVIQAKLTNSGRQVQITFRGMLAQMEFKIEGEMYRYGTSVKQDFQTHGRCQ